MKSFVPVVITRPLTLKKFAVAHRSKAKFVMVQERLFSPHLKKSYFWLID